ncbi:hypothetical protein OYC64_021995 [Pagothenia borchgrevinki]|uniref:Uncharacterized protein n=1 Tax=Pagothenia borchgrevinki TaxID=8213 RepID=A0ABD2G2D9_PAGBO
MDVRRRINDAARCHTTSNTQSREAAEQISPEHS